jgi:hypothetical protein
MQLTATRRKNVKCDSFNITQPAVALMTGLLTMCLLVVSTGLAQPKPEKSRFTAQVTDTQGIETELKHAIFYWEEKVSETSFVPHELVHIPVKQGSATVNVKFEKIKQLEVKASADKAPPAVTITLTTGKTGEFSLAVNGTFKGETDFGEVELPANGLKKVVFK